MLHVKNKKNKKNAQMRAVELGSNTATDRWFAAQASRVEGVTDTLSAVVLTFWSVINISS